MSACQIASPSPSPPIGTPASWMLEITFISGWSARNGRPSGLGPGGSSSPKFLLNASSCGSESCWSRKRSTRCSSHAARICAKTGGAIGCERSSPRISAPSVSPSFFASSKFHHHGLMVGRLGLRIDAHRLQARHQIGSDENEVAAQLGFVVVQVERGLARLARVQRFPRVDEAAVEYLLVVRVGRRQVEVAAYEGTFAS